MTLQNPTYIQDICYTARDDRLQMAGMLASEGVANFSSIRVTQQAVASKSIDISAGHVYINNDQDTSVGEGGYYHAFNDGVVSVLIADNISGSTRTDYVWLKITDTAYVAGTSGASFVVNQTAAPSDGSTYYRLATLSVPNGFTSLQGYPASFGATDNQITDERRLFQVSGAGGLIGRQVFTASGTFTTADYPGAKYIDVTVVGGGGAGGGPEATASTPTSSCGLGGGAGGTAKKALDIDTVGVSQAVTVGAGGTGVSGNTGNSGSSSSFGSLVVATGGTGGGVIGAGTAIGVTGSSTAVGGIGTVGDVLMRGGTGGHALRADGSAAYSGSGGNSSLGGGANGRGQNSSASQPGLAGDANTGGGGGGGTNSGSQTAKAGGTGGSGIVIVDIYG